MHIAQFLENPQTADRVADLVQNKNCNSSDIYFLTHANLKYLTLIAAAFKAMDSQARVVTNKQNRETTSTSQES